MIIKMSNPPRKVINSTYGIFQRGRAAKNVVFYALEEGDSILSLGLEISGGVELLDVLIKALTETH